MTKNYVAVDLGGSCGRITLGTLAGMGLTVREIHRFSTAPVKTEDGLHCDVFAMWKEIKQGLRRVSIQHGADIDGIGITTWAQDFALLDSRGGLLDLPFFYRDIRQPSALDHLHTHFSEPDLYRTTGICDYAASTLCQLLSIKLRSPHILDIADSLLLLPSLFIYWLSGYKINESTAVGMSQLYDLDTGKWSDEILLRLGLPRRLLTRIVTPGTVLGPLSSSLAEDTGLSEPLIIATACHDTAAAVAAVPTAEDDPVFISSGTWSIIGTEMATPQTTSAALKKHFINELGLNNRFIFAYNSAGFWILQECYRECFQSGQMSDRSAILRTADSSPSFEIVIDPNSPCFFSPGDMIAKITTYCYSTGQNPPVTLRDLARAVLESLALRYRKAIEDLQELVGRQTDHIHMVGGGASNSLLCQMTADATNRLVVAGPVEAAASATILIQAMAEGEISSVDELREVTRRSSRLAYYEPQDHSAWDEGYARFTALLDSSSRLWPCSLTKSIAQCGRGDW